MKKMFLGAALVMCAAAPAFGQAAPVATQCAQDIQTYCAREGHGSRQTRNCLETNRDKVSAECRQALDTTGPGRGKPRSK
jgi:hypothetical protein